MIYALVLPGFGWGYLLGRRHAGFKSKGIQ